MGGIRWSVGEGQINFWNDAQIPERLMNISVVDFVNEEGEWSLSG